MHDQYERPQHEARGNYKSKPGDTLLGGELPTDADRDQILLAVLQKRGIKLDKLPVIKVPTQTFALTH